MLQDRTLATVQHRVTGLAEKLARVEEELRQRGLKEMSTSQLYALAASLRRQIERETGPIRLVTSSNATPKVEYVGREMGRMWKGADWGRRGSRPYRFTFIR